MPVSLLSLFNSLYFVPMSTSFLCLLHSHLLNTSTKILLDVAHTHRQIDNLPCYKLQLRFVETLKGGCVAACGSKTKARTRICSKRNGLKLGRVLYNLTYNVPSSDFPGENIGNAGKNFRAGLCAGQATPHAQPVLAGPRRWPGYRIPRRTAPRTRLTVGCAPARSG